MGCNSAPTIRLCEMLSIRASAGFWPNVTGHDTCLGRECHQNLALQQCPADRGQRVLPALHALRELVRAHNFRDCVGACIHAVIDVRSLSANSAVTSNVVSGCHPDCRSMRSWPPGTSTNAGPDAMATSRSDVESEGAGAITENAIFAPARVTRRQAWSIAVQSSLWMAARRGDTANP